MFNISATPSIFIAARVPELVKVAPTPDVPLLYVVVRTAVVATLTDIKSAALNTSPSTYVLLVTSVPTVGPFDEVIVVNVGVLVVAILWGKDSVMEPAAFATLT